jgi:hypothetical protein
MIILILKVKFQSSCYINQMRAEITKIFHIFFLILISELHSLPSSNLYRLQDELFQKILLRQTFTGYQFGYFGALFLTSLRNSIYMSLHSEYVQK